MIDKKKKWPLNRLALFGDQSSQLREYLSQIIQWSLNRLHHIRACLCIVSRLIGHQLNKHTTFVETQPNKTNNISLKKKNA